MTARHDSRPRSEGGTGVKDFDRHELSVLARAIREHGDARICIKPHTMGFRNEGNGMMSLHAKPGADLEKFWKVVEQIKAREGLL